MQTYPMAMVTSPGQIEYIEKRVPEPGTCEVLIAVKAAAICGSDLHIYKGRHPSAPLPVAVGHEVSGQVIRVGADVTRVGIGDRVAIEPVIVCDVCDFCRRGAYHLCANISFQYRVGQGGFAPYFLVHENWAHKLSPDISYEEGALIEPLAVSVHAVRRANFESGMTVAVFGDGAIALLTLMVAHHAGSGDIFLVGIQPPRLELALELGANQAFNNLQPDSVQKILQVTADKGVDRSFEAVGIESTLQQSLEVLKKGGTAVLLGIFEQKDIHVTPNLFIQKEISLVGSQGYNWDFQRAIKIAEQQDFNLRSLITHTLPLSKLQQGFELLLQKNSQAVKVVIKMDYEEGLCS